MPWRPRLCWLSAAAETRAAVRTRRTTTVYLQLGEDGTFTLYQSIGTFGYARFTGTYALVGDPATGQVLSGTYADGTPWDSSYAVEKMTKRELRLRALKDGVVSVYSGVAIPAAVKDGVTAGRLRSAAQGESFRVGPRNKKQRAAPPGRPLGFRITRRPPW